MEVNKVMQWLIDNEYVVQSGVDKDGDPTYTFTQKIADEFPAFLRDQFNEFDQGISRLWLKNAIEIYFDEDGEPLIEVTNASYAMAALNLLEEDEHQMLIELIKIWEKKEGDKDALEN